MEGQEPMVRIRRVAGQPIATCISYQEGERLEQWRPEANKQEFEVSAVIAAAAVAEGYFEVTPESRAKLKGPSE